MFILYDSRKLCFFSPGGHILTSSDERTGETVSVSAQAASE